MTSPILPSDVERIAKGLSKAQRAALVTAVGGTELWVTRWKYGRSVHALHHKGLVNAPPPGPGGLVAILTARGKQVRAHLLAQEKQS